VTAFLRRRLKHIADVRFSNVDKLAEAGEAPVRLCNYTDVYNNERIDAAMPFMTATATTAEIRRFRLHVGDVILTKDSESPTDIAVPAVVASTAADLVCGYHLAMVRPRRGVLLGRYLQRALQADGIRQQFYLSANGVTRFGLSQDAIGNALVPVPPLRNQEVIADFLDMRTLAIDALIDKQEQLLRLLAEKRQVVITQAVTKGLDLSVPMKDSGVDWVGPCPAGWLRVRVSYVADVCNGSTPDRNNDAYWVNGDIPWLSSGKVNDFIVNEATEFITARALRETSVLRELGRGGQQDALNCEIIKAFRVPLPPLAEQGRIVAHVHEALRRMDGLVHNVEAQVEKLREYRQALITAAVTGKLDISVAPSAPRVASRQPEAARA
jgi:type I restriction enzyme S subunit